MTSATENPMKSMYSRLRVLGLTKPFVRKTILPDWWDDEVATSPAGFAEALVMISRYIGIDPARLRDPEADLALPTPTHVKFKRSRGSSAEDVSLAQNLAVQVMRHAMVGTPAAPKQLPTSALDIRAQILDKGEAWVGLEGLLHFLWDHGVPVLHVANYPRSAKRMDGLATRVGDRPGIVVSVGRKNSSWLLFVLAHELGHICLGHVEANGVLTDANVDADSEDDEEKAANEFAVELLTGSARRTWRATGTWPNARDLARYAIHHGRQHQIDPGHIALSYANNKNFYPVAVAALKLIEPKPRGGRTIDDIMAERLDWSRLPEEASEFLMRMTQIERP
ncbi:MAG: ImmA/IrrE family metallo-endopeptidase [Sandaracinaceae bacterium]|nr:ImmA/IrrE family metallo-endopeptidase [Sandaracinaceae bacterium]